MAEQGEAKVALIETPVDSASGHLTIYSSKRLDVYSYACPVCSRAATISHFHHRLRTTMHVRADR
ncbi:hypothetical protein BN2475_30079 [Paraburkholderia ribeironis]|uniref:Uncharacterized protein n=1 Tax=Paraburkholderia ribeironis TaxID=1247936 RepID=A0A1N7RIZ7_9BURK|nr:hypothetical protein BN2475_30079 [Paraburkholderia ribeironis]